MALRTIELWRGGIDLVSPFRTSFGTDTSRDLLYVHAVGDSNSGWGECVAGVEPNYSSEYLENCVEVISRFLVPLINRDTTAESFIKSATPIRGNYMSKACVEAALLDMQLRDQDISMAKFLGATKSRVASGVSVGIQNSLDDLVRVVGEYIARGYVRVKLKIEPGTDIELVRTIRKEFGDELLMQVDANAAYTIADASHLKQLDAFNLLLIEQPLPEDDLAGHVELSRVINTPVCLDESVTSLDTARGALDLKACSVINIKPGRVGGYLEAKKIHDLCLERGVPVWCGGMLETGIGRAANLALAALPGFTLPGDISASARYFDRDITEPFVINNGHIDVPNTVGIGVAPLPEMLAKFKKTASFNLSA
ncbi:MAG: o-succinylbenzoate synthase [Actinomycetota bacterium]|nr:o-succinylbenzoate synthase [Actinomycetota bacterium]